MKSPSRVRVRVPGSTSNCGPGFDTLGLSLSLYNTVELETVASDGELRVEWADGSAAPALIDEAARAFFQTAKAPPRGSFRVRIAGDVPPARGLGSSATLRVGVFVALNALHGRVLDRLAIARAVTRLEGHPDNATAATFGGLCVSTTREASAELIDCLRIEIAPTLRFVAASPELEIDTGRSRASLPAEISRPQLVRNLGSLAFFVAAFAARDYKRLRGAVEDCVHEPHRLPHIPGAAGAIRAGVAAGAWLGWLSGSGSSVLCMCRADTVAAVGVAMERAFAAAGVRAAIRLLAADHAGAQMLD